MYIRNEGGVACAAVRPSSDLRSMEAPISCSSRAHSKKPPCGSGGDYLLPVFNFTIQQQSISVSYSFSLSTGGDNMQFHYPCQHRIRFYYPITEIELKRIKIL